MADLHDDAFRTVGAVFVLVEVFCLCVSAVRKRNVRILFDMPATGEATASGRRGECALQRKWAASQEVARLKGVHFRTEVQKTSFVFLLCGRFVCA